MWWVLLAGRLPLRLLRLLGALLGLALYSLNSREMRTIRTNLQRCLPDQDQDSQRTLIRSIMMHAGMAALENFWIWARSSDRLVELVEVEGSEVLESARNAGKGLVVLSIHGANPDLLTRWAGSALDPAWSIYTAPRTSRIWARLLPKLRARKCRLQVAPTDRGAPALRNLYRALKKGANVVVWTDLDPVQGTGHYAPLFGQQAHTPVLPHRLICSTDAEPIWGWCSRTSGGFKVNFCAPSAQVRDPDPAQGIAAINRDLEKVILTLGEQYFYWAYKRFRHQPKVGEE